MYQTVSNSFTVEQVFLRCSRDAIQVPRIENRVFWVRENYRRVLKIRQNRVPTDPYQVPNNVLKKTAVECRLLDVRTVPNCISLKAGVDRHQRYSYFWLSYTIFSCDTWSMVNKSTAVKRKKSICSSKKFL